MSKSHATISIDSGTLEKARKNPFLNISAECEKALEKAMNVKEAEKKSIIHVCSECKKEIESGYFCGYHEIFLCDECQDKWDFRKCIFAHKNDGLSQNRIHFHERFGIIKSIEGLTLKDIEKGIKIPHQLN